MTASFHTKNCQKSLKKPSKHSLKSKKKPFKALKNQLKLVIKLKKKTYKIDKKLSNPQKKPMFVQEKSKYTLKFKYHILYNFILRIFLDLCSLNTAQKTLFLCSFNKFHKESSIAKPALPLIITFQWCHCHFFWSKYTQGKISVFIIKINHFPL
jgi:hypothetical protein